MGSEAMVLVAGESEPVAALVGAEVGLEEAGAEDAAELTTEETADEAAEAALEAPEDPLPKLSEAMPCACTGVAAKNATADNAATAAIFALISKGS